MPGEERVHPRKVAGAGSEKRASCYGAAIMRLRLFLVVSLVGALLLVVWVTWGGAVWAEATRTLRPCPSWATDCL